MFYFRVCIPKIISRMIYFRFLSSHHEVNPAKNDTLELKLTNRHPEIQSTADFSGYGLNLNFIPYMRKHNLNFIPIFLD